MLLIATVGFGIYWQIYLDEVFLIKIIKNILSLIISILLLAEWFWYMLMSADIPPVFTGRDINITICLLATAYILLAIEIVIIAKFRIRGSYLVLITGLLTLILLSATLRGQNFSIGDTLTNLHMQRILVTGIVLCALSAVSQLSQIMIFYLRRKGLGDR